MVDTLKNKINSSNKNIAKWITQNTRFKQRKSRKKSTGSDQV